jgi:hypothetical protein
MTREKAGAPHAAQIRGVDLLLAAGEFWSVIFENCPNVATSRRSRV